MWAAGAWEGMGFAEVRLVDWMGVSLDEPQFTSVSENQYQSVVSESDVGNINVMRNSVEVFAFSADNIVVLEEPPQFIFLEPQEA